MKASGSVCVKASQHQGVRASERRGVRVSERQGVTASECESVIVMAVRTNGDQRVLHWTRKCPLGLESGTLEMDSGTSGLDSGTSGLDSGTSGLDSGTSGLDSGSRITKSKKTGLRGWSGIPPSDTPQLEDLNQIHWIVNTPAPAWQRTWQRGRRIFQRFQISFKFSSPNLVIEPALPCLRNR